MRHDRHFVEELGNQSNAAIGMMVPLTRIETNREQPRADLGDLSELAASIRARGVLEPLLVRVLPGGKKYQLIAGERRYHAAAEAGLEEVPCVEIAATDQEALELALIENLQRRDLSPFEEAEGYRTLVSKYGYTHDQVATAVGKSRTTVTDTLKLLAIPPALQDLCRHADITAKSILLLIARAGTIQEMEALVQRIAEGNLDRDSARLAAQAAITSDDLESALGDDDPDAEGEVDQASFRPIHIRFQSLPSSPVRISLSIRQAGISRREIIEQLETLLDRVKSGDLDGRLSPKPSDAE
jgi:ParB family chromosome partitioning protein